MYPVAAEIFFSLLAAQAVIACEHAYSMIVQGHQRPDTLLPGSGDVVGIISGTHWHLRPVAAEKVADQCQDTATVDTDARPVRHVTAICRTSIRCSLAQGHMKKYSS